MAQKHEPTEVDVFPLHMVALASPTYVELAKSHIQGEDENQFATAFKRHPGKQLAISGTLHQWIEENL